MKIFLNVYDNSAKNPRITIRAKFDLNVSKKCQITDPCMQQLNRFCLVGEPMFCIIVNLNL